MKKGRNLIARMENDTMANNTTSTTKLTKAQKFAILAELPDVKNNPMLTEFIDQCGGYDDRQSRPPVHCHRTDQGSCGFARGYECQPYDRSAPPVEGCGHCGTH